MEHVAIVGLSALFPEAADVRAFWDNIVAARDCIVDVPSSRWLLEDHYDPDPSARDRTYCRRGGFIPDVDFDPLEWGLPPNSLEITDVAQLLSLVLAKRAFLDAGYGDGARTFDGERTAVVLGVGGGQKLITPLTSRLQEPVWRQALESSGVTGELANLIVEKIGAAYVQWGEDSFPGLLGNVIAGRIANRFDLGGLNCVVDAACASSFAALRMALDELTTRRADMVLTGGVDADNSPFMYLCFSKTPAFSRSNRTRPFDADSDGMLVGEGIGMLVLKRLEDAKRDHDRIYAVIRGLGASSDGRFKSIYAPRTEGQARALRRAYAAAGVEPNTVGLVEAHGTGTVAGDLCEIDTLRGVFDADGNGGRNRVALGSVKSQIGHTKAAAGAAGLIKAALALHHKVLPPTINVDRPNPALGLDDSSLYLNVEAQPWLRLAPDAPRRASVSAFGFGGTNFHVVLEEHEREQSEPYRLHGSAREVLVSAETPLDLADRCALLAGEAMAGGDFESLLSAAADRIPEDAARVGFVAGDAEECATLLKLAGTRIVAEPDAETWDLPQGIHYRARALDTRNAMAALFPGQGSQYPGMGRTLALSFPPVRERLAAVDSLFLSAGEARLSEAIYPPAVFDELDKASQDERLRATVSAQPAIATLSAAMFRLLGDVGFEANFAAGHSFGELTALWAAGAMEEETLFELSRERGRAMTAAPDSDGGAMLAVSGNGGSPLANAISGIDGVIVANVNAPDQIVIAGPTSAIEDAKNLLDARGYSTTRLPVAAAFHTPLVRHAQAPFADAVRAASVLAPRIPVFATATGEPYPGTADETAEQLAEQLTRPVQWTAQVEALYAAGARVFVEVGPGRVLTGLVRRILADRPHIAVALDAGPGRCSERQFRDGIVHLRTLGLQLDELDRYRRLPDMPPASKRAGKGLTIRLNGASYMSERTRDAYAATLVRPAPDRIDDKESPDVSTEPSPSAAWGPVAALTAHQRELLQLQQQLVTAQLELSRSLVELAVKQPKKAARVEVLDALQQQQAAMLQQHERFVTDQMRYMEAVLGRIEQQPPPAPLREHAPAPTDRPAIAPAPTPAPTPPPVLDPIAPTLEPPAPAPPAEVAETEPAEVSRSARVGNLLEELQTAMLEVVSEKTGYPVETLELDMDIEADLGIDSIKRVEILGAMQARFADLPALRPEELGPLRTLQEVVDYLRRFELDSPDRVSAHPGTTNGKVEVAVPRLRSLPPPDALAAGLPAGYCAVITDDGTATTSALARELLAHGAPTVVLRFPDAIVPTRTQLPDGIAELSLDSLEEDRIADVLREVAARHGSIGTFIHLHPRAASGELIAPEQEEVLRSVFLVATHLRPSLEQSARAGRGSFVVVTRLDGELGTGNGDFDPAGGGLYGLAKTIRQEWPGVFCRAVDLAPTYDAESAARAVLDELADPDERLVEVGYGVHGRVTLAVALND
jgi:acyl transferase domain-containing protein